GEIEPPGLTPLWSAIPKRDCNARMPDAQPAGSSQGSESIFVAPGKQASAESFEQFVSAHCPGDRQRECLRAQDRARRVGCAQRGRRAAGKDEAPGKRLCRRVETEHFRNECR